MMEIQGKVNTALCYASVIEEGAVEQIRRMCDYALTEGSRIRIMPDAHKGIGCTVGTTMTVRDKVCPNIVGVDIGCGMYTVRLQEKEIDFEKVDAAAHFIPSADHVWEKEIASFDLTALRCFDELKNKERLSCSLGTLGGGNHFIEIDRAKDGTCYLVIHSGSRNLGVQTANLYQARAIRQHTEHGTFQQQKQEIIRTCREQGLVHEIQPRIEKLERAYMEGQSSGVPSNLCWLEGDELQDYLHDVEICQKFACRNRELMAEILLGEAGLHAQEAFHTIHNYINTQEMILRKGAIAAHRGEKVLIPINMRDGSVLAVGKGNPEWNESAPHGAGRLMSRNMAKETISLEDYASAMEGIYTTTVNASTLDEAPMAYKSLKDIVDVIQDTVEIIEIMKPVYNFKAGE